VMLIYSKRFRVRGWSNWHRHYIGAELAAVVNQIIGVRSATNARSWSWKPPCVLEIDTFPIRGRAAPFDIPACSLDESQATRHPRMSLAGVQVFEKTWIPAKSTRE
jgi:hypothetical protein